ncbi:hypothetical protein [Corallococcus macrosporus]|uniref:Uncharacterized protein n=1 Tax=Myxococcus fulvus (strain ATCC BAA-855 / HW-1) TaxID=483219 RepID=F8CRL9_MYXFH|nr:hypothetical protein [Corallococcus macrosporus]AEI65564.1 hypothetical protein LILAB_18310 [Corallococcus macrosporus]
MPAPQDLLTAALLHPAARAGVETGRLALFITAASEAVASFVGYPLHRRMGVVESVAGTGGPYLWLAGGAVRQVVRVEVRGEELDATSYAVDSALMGRLVARSSRWPFTGSWTTGVSPTPLEARDTGEVVVTYDAGWVTPGQAALDSSLQVDLPAAIQLAAVEADAGPGRVGLLPAGGPAGRHPARRGGGRDGGPLARWEARRRRQ